MADSTTEGLTIAINNLTTQLNGQGAKIEEMSKDMRVLISNQTEIRELRKSLSRAFEKIEDIEKNGGQILKNHLDIENLENKNLTDAILKIVANSALLEARIQKIEDMPNRVISTIGKSIIVVFGTSVGLWILYKLGFNEKVLK